MNPLVSLVSPVYNAMPYLQDYLTCLATQTWRPLEVILVDDGSTDDSACCLRQYQAVLEAAGLSVKLLFCPHRGQAAAMNAALPLIRGAFFTWCDADDLLTPDSVEKKVLWLLNNPQIGMVRSNGRIMDADRGILLSETAKENDRQQKDIFEELLLDQTYCFAGCYMLRTELFFACYPDKKIPESPEGQNLQLLLPPASRSVCGFLEEPLHTYCRRGSGHSSRKRSYRQTLQRLENFAALRLEILEYCSCDKPYFTSLANAHAEKKRRQLLYSAALQARKERKHENRNSDLP